MNQSLKHNSSRKFAHFYSRDGAEVEWELKQRNLCLNWTVLWLTMDVLRDQWLIYGLLVLVGANAGLEHVFYCQFVVFC